MPGQTVQRKHTRSKPPRKRTRKKSGATFGTPPVGRSAPDSLMPVLEPFVAAEESGRVTAQVTYLQIPGLDDAQKKLSDALTTFMDDLGTAIQDALVLEVQTYVSDNIGAVTVAPDGTFRGDVQLRARTTIKPDGDISALVPMQAERIDEALWTIHAQMVSQAQTNRTEMVKMALAAASAVIGALKPL